MSDLHPATLRHLISPHMRLGHLLWHAVRERWAQLPCEHQDEYSRRWPHWVPPRPSLDAGGRVIFDNGAGLDFLYAHRRMIDHINGLQRANGAASVVGWASPPAVDDRAHPVPRGPLLPDLVYRSKQDRIWTAFLREAQRYTADGYLRSIDLAVLGTQIEYGIHAAMHERFGGLTAVGLRLSQFDLVRPIESKWDGPEYDTLLDFYSAHVHPWFWRIHVWVDDRITDWERANGTLADFTGAWEGPMRHHPSHQSAGIAIAMFKEAVEAISVAGNSGWIRPRLFPLGLSGA